MIENRGAGEAGGLLNTDGLLRPLFDALQCPECREVPYGKNPESYVGALTCSKCRTHWWAFKFEAGSVRDQLLHDYYNDTALVDQMMAHFGLPDAIDRPKYWQVQLTGNQIYRYNRDRTPGPRGRSTQLLKGVIALHR